MNWPFETKEIKKLNNSAWIDIAMYMDSHAREFRNDDEATHQRAQTIADAVNANDPSLCGVDSKLATAIISCLDTMRKHISGGYPNALIACGFEPSVMFMVADNADEGKTTCVYFKLTLVDWNK